MAERRSSGARTSRVTARAVEVNDLPSPLPAVVLVVGDEELLVSRAIEAVTAAARAADPDLIEIERSGADIDGPELHELVGPALFGAGRLMVVRTAQDVRAAAQAVLTPYLQAPIEGTTIVLQHAGGAKGKALLETARKIGALELPCPRLIRADERAEFVRAEVRRAGGRIAPDAVMALLDAVGSDLRELAVTAAQLVSDSGGTIDTDFVRAFHQGRAEVSGFAVADLAVIGNTAAALEALRYALDHGVPHVVVADAFADGVRTVARVRSAGRGSEYELSKRLGLPGWKIKRAQSQSRGWTEVGMRHALRAVALLNADVKGEAADPEWALERAIFRLARARAVRG